MELGKARPGAHAWKLAPSSTMVGWLAIEKPASAATRDKLSQEYPVLIGELQWRNFRMSEQAQQMIQHVVQLIRKPGIVLDEDTPLVSSGLIDSMALVDLLLKLEDLTHMRIPAGKVQPKDLDTVAKMFATAQRVGKPRK